MKKVVLFVVLAFLNIGGVFGMSMEFVNRLVPVIKQYHDIFDDIAPIEDDRAKEIALAIWDWAKNYEVDPILVAAIIATESNFRNIKGKTRNDGLGYMQIKISTALSVALDDVDKYQIKHGGLILQPRLNIRLGTMYLRRLYVICGSWAEAIEAYNNDKTGRYLKKVVDNYFRIKDLMYHER